MASIFDVFTSPLFIEIVLLIASIIAPIVVILIVGRKAKIPLILRLMHVQYFYAEIEDEVHALHTRLILLKDITKVGTASYFKTIGGNYWLREDCVYNWGGIGKSFYDYGKPNPKKIIGLGNHSSWDKLFTDQEIKELVITSSQETQDAIDSKVVQDILRFTFNTMDKIFLIVAVISIAISGINLYFVYNINSDYSSLINQLNQILAHIVSTTSSG